MSLFIYFVPNLFQGLRTVGHGRKHDHSPTAGQHNPCNAYNTASVCLLISHSYAEIRLHDIFVFWDGHCVRLSNQVINSSHDSTFHDLCDMHLWLGRKRQRPNIWCQIKKNSDMPGRPEMLSKLSCTLTHYTRWNKQLSHSVLVFLWPLFDSYCSPIRDNLSI